MDNVKENDLVMLRLPNHPDQEGRQPHYNTWFRVKFLDIDGTFIGVCERIEKYRFILHSVGDHIRLPVDKIQSVYKHGDQFCYGDGVTICECKGLCRNK